MALHTMFPTVGHFPILSLVSEMLLRVVSAHVHSFQWRGSRGKHIILLLFLEESFFFFLRNYIFWYTVLAQIFWSEKFSDSGCI